MGTGEVDARAVAGAQRCECGHPVQRHELPGFDGECIAEGCRCTTYRARVTPFAAVQPGRPVPPAVRSGIEQMIGQGKRSQSKRTRALVDRLEAQVADLYGRLKAERAMIVAQAAAASAKHVVDAPLAPVMPLPSEDLDAAHDGAVHACPVEGCGFTSTRKTGLASHHRSAHQPVQLKNCPECGAQFRNVGPHRYRAHGVRAAS